VRGHRGHPKNEYANDLAIRAAETQETSAGTVDSGFAEWLAAKHKRGLFSEYDPDAAFEEIERRLAKGNVYPIAESRD